VCAAFFLLAVVADLYYCVLPDARPDHSRMTMPYAPLRVSELDPRRLRRSLLAALLLAACAPRVDAPAIWPEELRIRGSVLVLGEAVPQDAVRERFTELAGGDEARILTLRVGGDVSPSELEQATGIWLLEPDGSQQGGAFFPGAGVAAALHDVIERGGVVAAVGAAAVHAAEASVTGRGNGSVLGALGLIPGVVLHPSFRIGIDRSRLLSALEGSPRLFGVGVPANAALELTGRRLSALAGEVVLLIPAGNERPVREERLRAGANGRANQADLTAWRRDAIERTLPPFPGPAPAPPNVERGTLVIIGGGRVTQEINDAFIEAAGGRDARLVFVPPEEAEELAEEPGIVASWRILGVENASWIHTKDRRRADTDRVILDPLRNATGIWFGGGRQWNFSDSYYGTSTHRLMHEVLARGGVIAGTSAGASIQAEWMARGDPLGNQNIIAPGYERGLGFITGVAIDQHFTQRNRRPNMDELMAVYPQLLGIGIDESTALVVRGSVAQVIGDGNVFFFDRRADPRAEPVVLSAGAAYDLAGRRVIRRAAAQPAG
jgi:cyanophycinase